MTGRADAGERSIPVHRRAGIRYGDQDVRLEASVSWPPLIGGLDPTHVAELERQEVHAVLHAELLGKLGDPHLGPGPLIRAHRPAVGMAVNQESITPGGIIRLPPCDESLQIR